MFINYSTNKVDVFLPNYAVPFWNTFFVCNITTVGAMITYWIIWLSHQSPDAVAGLHLPKHLSDHSLITGLMNCTIL